jgi:hypothetical protein
VESVQPFHAGAQAHTAPIEVLRWLCNVDKHRFVHVVGRTYVDLAPVLVEAAVPPEVVEQWRQEGAAGDGTVVARLNIRRPTRRHAGRSAPTFAHLPTLQISDNPVDHRSLASAMDAMRDAVLQVHVVTTDLLGLAMPDPESPIKAAHRPCASITYRSRTPDQRIREPVGVDSAGRTSTTPITRSSRGDIYRSSDYGSEG